MSEFKDFMKLIEQGRIEEAQGLIEAQKEKAKYAPDTITAVKGKPPRFTKKGKAVELDENGNWRPKAKITA